MIYALTILWPASLALTGILCHYHGRKHRDGQWKWATLWKPDATQSYCHNITNTLPEKP